MSSPRERSPPLGWSSASVRAFSSTPWRADPARPPRSISDAASASATPVYASRVTGPVASASADAATETPSSVRVAASQCSAASAASMQQSTSPGRGRARAARTTREPSLLRLEPNETRTQALSGRRCTSARLRLK
eukprot:2251742-Prymnesium_polylepis.1